MASCRVTILPILPLQTTVLSVSGGKKQRFEAALALFIISNNDSFAFRIVC